MQSSNLAWSTRHEQASYTTPEFCSKFMFVVTSAIYYCMKLPRGFPSVFFSGFSFNYWMISIASGLKILNEKHEQRIHVFLLASFFLNFLWFSLMMLALHSALFFLVCSMIFQTGRHKLFCEFLYEFSDRSRWIFPWIFRLAAVNFPVNFQAGRCEFFCEFSGGPRWIFPWIRARDRLAGPVNFPWIFKWFFSFFFVFFFSWISSPEKKCGKKFTARGGGTHAHIPQRMPERFPRITRRRTPKNLTLGRSHKARWSSSRQSRGNGSREARSNRSRKAFRGHQNKNDHKLANKSSRDSFVSFPWMPPWISQCIWQWFVRCFFLWFVLYILKSFFWIFF